MCTVWHWCRIKSQKGSLAKEMNRIYSSQRSYERYIPYMYTQTSNKLSRNTNHASYQGTPYINFYTHIALANISSFALYKEGTLLVILFRRLLKLITNCAASVCHDQCMYDLDRERSSIFQTWFWTSCSSIQLDTNSYAIRTSMYCLSYKN